MLGSVSFLQQRQRVLDFPYKGIQIKTKRNKGGCIGFRPLLIVTAQFPELVDNAALVCFGENLVSQLTGFAYGQQYIARKIEERKASLSELL